MTSVTGRVAAGAAFLDEHDPGWWRADVERAIDLDKLDLSLGDRCILGQRCPVEAIVSYLGTTDLDADDLEHGYAAYAEELAGRFGDHTAMEAWAVKHGFNRPYGSGKAGYLDLTAEWRRVIEARRAA